MCPIEGGASLRVAFEDTLYQTIFGKLAILVLPRGLLHDCTSMRWVMRHTVEDDLMVKG